MRRGEIETGLLTPAAEMSGWMEEIVAQGVRRPAYPADEWTEGYVARHFDAFGLEDVRLEPVELLRWDDGACRLDAWALDGAGGTITLEGFPLPHSAPTSGLEADLVALGGSESVAGALAVSTLTLRQIPQTVMKALATSVYDPDDELAELVQTIPFSEHGQRVMEPAIEGGAAGFVGLLAGVPWETRDYYVPYDSVARPIPGAWISRTDSARLSALMARGPTRARLVAESTRRPTTSNNVVGVLPGASDEWVIVGTHHDGPWASAVEDASGVAMVLAQARYWSQVPPARRPHNLLFLVTAAHMCGGAGTSAFIAAHPDLLGRVVLEVDLGHAARQCDTDDAGRLLPTEEPEPRWWFTTRVPALEAAVAEALAANDLRRSLILKPDIFGPTPTTDGGFFHAEGVPLVNFLTAPMYLFDSQDTLDKIHAPSLVPVSAAAAGIISSTAAWTANDLRSQAEG